MGFTAELEPRGRFLCYKVRKTEILITENINSAMKKLLMLLVALAAMSGAKAGVQIPYTELNYNVHYHWGLINVMIAHGVVGIECDGETFRGTLDGNSIPWNGRVFCISDTLHAKFTPSSGLSKETVTYENGWYLKPKVTQFHSTSFSATDPANYKNIKGEGSLSASDNTMEAVTVTADMLGMFYYYKEIDFESMNEGQKIEIPIAVEGGEAQSVVVTFNGKSRYTANGVAYQTYATTFEYSYKGVMSGYPVRCEVSVDERIPVMISANLPVGHVEMEYHE